MICSSCNSNKICHILGHCSDCFNAKCNNEDYDGYVPGELGIGQGDDVEFSYCMDCGKIQGNWPASFPQRK